VRAGLREGDIGTALAEVAKAYPEVSIGSYPFWSETGPDTNVVVRSRDPEKLSQAMSSVKVMIESERARLSK
jgi:molybdopterin-biosynthesis enzyme MoeA-like protein